MPGKLAEVDARRDEVIRAYEDVGMRVSYSYAVRDQNRLVYQDDEEFVASLPPELRGPMQRWFDRFQIDARRRHRAVRRAFTAGTTNKRRVKIQLAPANLHWCSDEALTRLADASRKYDVPLHMHLLETAYQKEYARRRGGCTAVEYIDRFGLLGPQMTLGHGVWLNETDIDRLAATGTCVCHNCSSNFRLRSGVAALNVLRGEGHQHRDRPRRGRHQRRPRHAAGDADGAARASRARHGRRRADPGAGVPHGDVGRREDHAVRRDDSARWKSGRAADMVLIDWRADQLSLSRRGDAAARRGAAARQDQGVRTVICDGEVIYDDGKFTKVDRDGALRALHDDLQQGAGRRRGRAPQAVQGAAAACAGVLRQLLRPRAA